MKFESGAESRMRLMCFSWCHLVAHNVRRYVALPQSRGGACFCTRGAMQDYDVDLFILALAKTVTPAGGPRREPGRAVPLTTKRSSLARRFSRYGEAMTYTDLLCLGLILSLRCRRISYGIINLLLMEISPNQILLFP